MTTEKMLERVEEIAKWVAVTYGVEAIKDMAINLPKYIDAYNEAMFVAYAKLRASKGAMAAMAETVYTTINAEK